MAAAVRGVEVQTSPLRQLAPGLIERLEAAGSQMQRDVARFAARRAINEAGLGLGGMAAALDALDRQPVAGTV